MKNISKPDLRVTFRAFDHFIRVKLASYLTHRTLKVSTATRQKSSVEFIKDIVPEIGYITII